MKISAVTIIFEKNGAICLEDNDIITESCIKGGTICKNNDSGILLNRCFIENSKYPKEELEEVTHPCAILINCSIKDCELPASAFVECAFRDEITEDTKKGEKKKGEEK